MGAEKQARLAVVSDGCRPGFPFGSDEPRLRVPRGGWPRESELDAWIDRHRPTIVALDLEPEALPAWLDALGDRGLALLIAPPSAGSIAAHESSRDGLVERGTRALVAHRVVFSAGPLRVAALARSGRLGPISNVRLETRTGLTSLLRAGDKKALFDSLLGEVEGALSLLTHLGLDASRARVANELEEDYWSELRVELAPDASATLIVRPGPHDAGERLVLSAEHMSLEWRRRDGGEWLVLREGSQERKGKLPEVSPEDAMIGTLERALERDEPVEMGFGRQGIPFAAAARVVDEFLYSNVTRLRQVERKRAALTLRKRAGIWSRVEPYAYQNWDVAFRASPEVCRDVLRPVTRPFRLLLVRVPLPIGDDPLAAPLGLAQLAAVARGAGVETQLCDLAPDLRIGDGHACTRAELEGLSDELRRQVGEARFDLVGFSLDEAHLWPVVAHLIGAIRERTDHVVIGGRTVGRVDRSALTEAGLDFMIEGEGELGLVQLIHHLSGDAPIDEVSGLTHMKWPASRRANAPIFPSFEAHPPPDFDGLDLSRYVPATDRLRAPYLPYLFILGCPYRCAFCGNESNQKPRYRPARQVVDDLRHLRDRYRAHDFYFINNMINTHKGVLADFLDEMEVASLGVRWTDCGRPASLDRETLRRLAGVGCVELTWGVDTGSQRLSNLMRKGYKLERAVEVMGWAHEAGIANNCNMIVGMPHETDEDFEETRRFVRETFAMVRQFPIHPYQYAHKSPVMDAPATFGLRRKGDTYDELDGVPWREHLEKRDARVRTLHEDIERLRRS